jgi:16S rRNA (guanine1516-N2)-methyltransferase
MQIDFLSAKMLYRIKQASLSKELIARAMGFKPQQHPYLIDATAGFGQDSFILASLGFNLTLLERSPQVYALLEDALKRAQNDVRVTAIAKRLTLIHADALDWLKQNKTPLAQVIYLDPMFPEKKKSASSKKEMVFLQQLLGKDEDASHLLALALTCASARVVVKRPRLASYLGEHSPHFSLKGKSSRFDIYLTQI